MPLTSKKRTCGFLPCFSMFAGCHTHLMCDHAHVSLHGVFADGSRLHRPRVQFAASVTIL